MSMPWFYTDRNIFVAKNEQKTTLDTIIKSVKADKGMILSNTIQVQEESNTDEENLLSITDIFKTMCRLSWPTALSYTFSFQMVLLTVLSRQLGQDKNHQDAAALMTTFVNCIATVSISPLFASSMSAGHLIGQLKQSEESLNHDSPDETEARNIMQEKITETFRASFILAEGLLSPFAALCCVFSKDILSAVLRQNKDVSSIVQKFTRPYAATMPALMLRMCVEQQMFAQGKNTPPMIMAQISFLSSMFAGVTFAEGWFGLPKYGEDALLVACISEAYITAIAFSLYLFTQNDFRKFEFFDFTKSVTHLKEVFSSITRLGASFPLPFLIEFGMNFGATTIASYNGIASQARMGMMMQYGLPVQLLSSAFGQCTAQEMSRRLGENDKHNAARIGTVGLATTVFNIAPIAIFFAIFPNLLEGKTQVDDTSSTTHLLALTMSAGFIFDVVRFNMLQQLRVLNDANISAFISCVSLIIGLAVSVVLTTQTNFGIIGDAIGYTFGNLLASLSLGCRWYPRICAITQLEPQINTSNSSVVDISQHPDRLETLNQSLLNEQNVAPDTMNYGSSV